MKSRNAAFPVVPQMLFPPSGAAGFIATTESLRTRKLLSLSAPSMGCSRNFYRVISEGRVWGALLVYGDPKTKRPEDYFEFYDRETNLLAVGWFDRFGMEKLAIDRGLFDGSSRLQGVTLSDGKAL
jgi:hypothetical protein